MRRSETPKPIWIKFCLVVDITTQILVTIGYGVLRSGGQIYPFPIDFHRRPYNTTVLACDHSDFNTVSQKTSNFQFLNNSVKS